MKDIKTKFNAVIVSMMLILLIVLVVYSKTVYITDEQNTSCQWITNSLGDISNANNRSELQRLIWRLNSTNGGWVDGGKQNISISSTIYLGNNIELRNVKLWLANGANCTMIRNYDTTNGNYNIYIHDVTLFGNSMNHEVWHATIYPHSEGRHLILFWNVNHARIERINGTNAIHSGIWLRLSKNITIVNNEISWSGKKYNVINFPGWFCKGIFTQSCRYISISNNIIHDTWAGAVCFESTWAAPYSGLSSDWVADSNVIYNCHTGFWIENGRDGIISNNIINNCSKYGAYNYPADKTPPHGIIGSTNSYNVTVDGNKISYCGNRSGIVSVGYSILGGKNFIITNNYITNSYGRGIGISDNCIVSNNNISITRSTGIYCYAYNCTIIGNKLANIGHRGIYLDCAKTWVKQTTIVSENTLNRINEGGIYCNHEGASISNNRISNTASYGIQILDNFISVNFNTINFYTNAGIYFYDDLNNGAAFGNTVYTVSGGTGINVRTHINGSFTFNRVTGGTNGISMESGSDWNVVSFNNCQGCTTPFTLVSTSFIYKAGNRPNTP